MFLSRPSLPHALASALACLSPACSSSEPAEQPAPPSSSPPDASFDAGEAGAAGSDATAEPAAEGPSPDATDASDAAEVAQPGCLFKPTAAPAHFVDRTDAWGIGRSGLAVDGNRIVSADLDGDGYPELVVHALHGNAREVIGSVNDAGVHQHTLRVLMNRPKAGGGRELVDATLPSKVGQTRDGSTTELRSAHFAVAADVDNDGDTDLFSATYVDPTSTVPDTGDRSEILLNDGHGVFALAPKSDVSPGPQDQWTTSGATFTDVDRDGRVDLFVGFWYERYGFGSSGLQARLYRGKGDGTFSDATSGANLTTTDFGFEDGTNHRPAYGVTSCDLDGDGAPELLVSAYGRQWNALWLNDGTGKFAEVGRASGYAGDDNLDFHDNQFFLCWCTMHGTDPACSGVAKPSVLCPSPADSYWDPDSDAKPWRLNGNTFATVCADLSHDGRADLYSAEIHHWWAGQSSDSSELLVNDGVAGKPHFARSGNGKTGMAWPHKTKDWNEGGLMAASGDLDNDGLEDLVVAASDYPDQYGLLFHQKPDGTFEETGQAWGFRHACVSGLSIVDLDRDGDLDLVVGSGTARDCKKTGPTDPFGWYTNEVHVYENQLAGAGHWLLVRLVGNGTDTNRMGIGATVTVRAGGEAIVKELGGGYGHFGMQNDTVLFFGLGECASADSIEVRWPNGALTKQSFQNVTANRFIQLTQGDPSVVDVKL
jgi:hypothetical protein